VKVLLKLIFVSISLFTITYLLSCANQLAPSGGPQDKEPPVVISSLPPNFSTHFDKNKIRVTFNEFVQLKQADEQILISPPVQKKPDYNLKGKSLFINLKEDLLPNTTYSFFFGNSITDITEGNPLTNFLYVFSTGDYLDSLSIAGEVKNAFNLKPEEGVFVMLYPISNDTIPADSLPMKIKPSYVTKTDKEGNFRLNYLRNEPMKLFALKDINNNYLYDTPDEEIAFTEEIVIPEHIKTMEPDTTLGQAPDSIHTKLLYDNFFHLKLFQQIDSTQRRLSETGFYPPGFLITYRYGLKNPVINLFKEKNEAPWYIKELNKGRDSLRVWLTQPMPDSITIKIQDGDFFSDTVLIVLPEKKTPETSKRRQKEETKQTEQLIINSNVKSRLLELNTPLELTFEHPIKNYNKSHIWLFSEKDTVLANFSFADNANRKLKLIQKLEEETLYNLVIRDSTFFDIYDHTHNSLVIVFNTRKTSDYGNLYLDVKIKNDSIPYILQLLDPKENVIHETVLNKSEELAFELLNPGIYTLKAIEDKHTNGVWDTGDYLKKREPEKVFFFQKELQIRTNWDIEEVWKIE